MVELIVVATHRCPPKGYVSDIFSDIHDERYINVTMSVRIYRIR